jgi:hypothetical protein
MVADPVCSRGQAESFRRGPPAERPRPCLQVGGTHPVDIVRMRQRLSTLVDEHGWSAVAPLAGHLEERSQ